MVTPGSTSDALAQADALLAAGNYTQAISLYNQALTATNGSDAKALLGLAKAYYYKTPSEPDIAREYLARVFTSTGGSTSSPEGNEALQLLRRSGSCPFARRRYPRHPGGERDARHRRYFGPGDGRHRWRDTPAADRRQRRNGRHAPPGDACGHCHPGSGTARRCARCRHFHAGQVAGHRTGSRLTSALPAKAPIR